MTLEMNRFPNWEQVFAMFLIALVVVSLIIMLS